MRRARAALKRCPAHCGEDDPPPRYLDRTFALGEISPDQARLARVITAAPGSRMLHIGVGCSDLARRFTGVQIDGITVLDDEVAVALALRLPAYRVWKMNKYSLGFSRLPGPYDHLVDNNPGSYACCRAHFHRMTDAWARMLAPGGTVWTEERGASWRQAGGLSLDWDAWAAEGTRVGLRPERRGTVWMWRHSPATSR